MPLPTPEYFHCLTNPQFRYNVYEPEADSFLFVEALEKEAGCFAARRPQRRCVEVGCGSGIVISFLHTVLSSLPQNTELSEGSQPPPQFFAVDVNPLALQATATTWCETGRKQYQTEWGVDYSRTSLHTDAPSAASGVNVLHLVEGDLLTPFLKEDDESEHTVFDVVLFNPPYVPTSMEELQDAIEKKDVITAAWCGGTKGRVVLDRFLRMLPQHLSPTGVCYIVLIKENDMEEVRQLVFEIFEDEAGLTFDAVAQRYTGEHLGVYRIARGGAASA